MGNPKVIVFSGAGMSAESGISTFRDSGGTWEKHDLMEVATPQGWKKNPEMVLNFYNDRRRQLMECEPNAAHKAIAEAEKDLNIEVITQNIDDLHERAGSTNVIHLHGELLKVRSSKDPSLVYEWRKDLQLGDKCDRGSQLRPHVVWFGEAVPTIPIALDKVSQADYMLIIGTSLQVYPAAGIVEALPDNATLYYVDPNPQLSNELLTHQHKQIIEKPASEGVPIALEAIKKETANAS